MIDNKTVNKKHNISFRLIELLYRKIFELIIIHFNNIQTSENNHDGQRIFVY